MQGQQDVKTQHSVRQSYDAPQLIEFGRVRDLTAGGSGDKDENHPLKKGPRP